MTPGKKNVLTGHDDTSSLYTNEREYLFSPHATRSADAIRRKNKRPEDIRTPFSRDADRIIHTRAYTRYIDKTQVFYLVENDHITHRVIHVQLVSKIARTIGRSLRLNEDLIEAVALGHDIGHIPYGHFGEQCLSDLCMEHGIGRFAHNVESIRFLDQIEDQDLTLQVLDGILCHNGESNDLRISPQPCQGWAEFDDKVAGYARGDRMDPPATLEGCVVKFADTIAYIGRDLQDAQEVGLIEGPGEIPPACREVLGADNRAIVDTLIRDLIENSESDREAYISYSSEVEHALIALRDFSRKRIYENPKLTAERGKIVFMYQVLFEKYLDDVEAGRHSSRVFGEFIDSPWVSREYARTTAPAGLVRDYLSGMTDRYFQKRFEECVIPKRVERSFQA